LRRSCRNRIQSAAPCSFDSIEGAYRSAILRSGMDHTPQTELNRGERKNPMSAPSESARIDQGPSPSTRSMLVVADLDLNATLFDHLLTREWAVEYVSSNEEALSLLRKRSFDLILTAEGTSAKEDLSLLKQIRAVRPRTRMIILARESTPQDVILALRQHAFSIFTRPYSFETLKDMIEMAMERPSWDDGIEVVQATPSWARFLVRCDTGTAERMMQFFSEMIDLPEEEKGQVAYALREMVMNAVAHGGKFDPSQYVEVGYLHTRHMVGCRIKDPGQGFALDELLHAAIANPLDDPVRHITIREAQGLPPGGYGILLSRHLVDELLYNEKGNEVVLLKYLRGDAPPGVAGA
jgi:anti-sigma regulatory factor (Ser/Thr protein kinase)/CheY-like chemotaxis protein